MARFTARRASHSTGMHRVLIDIKQIQSIRQAWRCSHCGASGTEVTREGHEHCDACGELLHDDQRFTYLEPAGFAVDLYAPTHTDVSEQSFVPVSQPWINAEGPWLPLANQALGSFRSSSTGRVFNHSGGVNRNGYAICLNVAEPSPCRCMPMTRQKTAWAICRQSSESLTSACVGHKEGKPLSARAVTTRFRSSPSYTSASRK